MQTTLHCALLTICLACLMETADAQQDERPRVRFGVVIDGPWAGNDAVRAVFESEIETLLRREFDVRFPAAKRVVADWTLDSVRAAVEGLLGDPEVDFFLAMGPVSSHVTAGLTQLDKPAVAAFVLDAELQGLPRRDGGSGITNLSYVSIPLAVQRGLEAFLEVARFRRLAFVANPHFLDAAPGLAQRAQEAAQALGLEATLIAANPPAASVLQVIPPDAEAVYLTPLLHFPPDDWDQLIAGINSRRLPSFSALGVAEVERGVLATLGTDQFFPRIARRVALNVQSILLGEDAARLPVAFAAGERLTINMATARAVGRFPSWSVLTEAVLLNEEIQDIPRSISLTRAVQEAVDGNLDALARDRAVAAGAENIREARSALLPQLDLSTTATIIDSDRAEASLGSQAQRTLTGGATLSQVLFSEAALANVTIQRHVQTTREVDREALELDIALEAATAYLNVLRAKALERIQKNNLNVTRSNLELARVRNAIGTSGPGEVFRWEAELANDRIAVIEAQAERSLVEVALNRLLNRPLEELFRTVEAGPDDPSLLVSDPRLLRYVDNPQLYRVFRDFMVLEGMTNAPELRNVDAAIAAQRRAYRSAANTFWAPTVALQTSLSGRLAQGGVGSEFQLTLPPGTPDLSSAFPQANDVNWSVGVHVSLPLLRGGARFADRTRASQELEQLLMEQGSVAQRVEQRIRSTLHDIGASFSSISLSAEAAGAARRNLELVTEAYSRGVVSILDLLDAQNASLAADEVAANAVYVFLIDMMALQRAVGRFDFFLTSEQREAFFERLEAYFGAVGLRPR